MSVSPKRGLADVALPLEGEGAVVDGANCPMMGSDHARSKAEALPPHNIKWESSSAGTVSKQECTTSEVPMPWLRISRCNVCERAEHVAVAGRVAKT